MIISYAQNNEDVLLWRALNWVQNGFYIDVGACEPVSESVTKLFYEKGWRGINIEPSVEAFNRLTLDRPQDINLNIAVSECDGSVDFYSVDNGGGLSTCSKEVCEIHKTDGRQIDVKTVSSLSLDSIFNAYISRPVHFLKIDVEGFELNVLRGSQFKICRPWVIIIEATIPNTQTENFAASDTYLINSNYTYVFFDGLNRYYVSNEMHPKLRKHFQSPVSIFDKFTKYNEVKLRNEISELKNELLKLDGLNYPDFANNGDTYSKIQSVLLNIGNLSDRYLALQEKCKEDKSELQSKLFLVNERNEFLCQELFESNRYIGYLSKERANALIKLHENATELNCRYDELNFRYNTLNSQYNLVKNDLQCSNLVLDNIISSKTWRCLAPLRNIYASIRKLFGNHHG